MESKQPVLLTVLVETARLRWFVAAIPLDGALLPLLCSEVGDLDPYLGVEFDEQVSFLRHRFSGVLQRGCDRLWARTMKPCQIVFLFDAPLQGGAGLHGEGGLLAEGGLQGEGGQLTQRVGEHFVEWMANPPVVAFLSESGFTCGVEPKLTRFVGTLGDTFDAPLHRSLPELMEAVSNATLWEVSPKKVKK